MPDSLYVHIPFCLKRCIYCDFVSGIYDPGKAADYIEALRKEIACIPANTQFSTLYIGGGTPTVLSAALLSELINFIFTNFDFTENYEATIEANPGTVDTGKLQTLRSAGINRISIGIQSFHDEELAFLGRIHSARDAEDAVCIAKDSGFESIGIDLIYGIPGQDMRSWAKTLEKTACLKPDHISAYELTPEEGTLLHKYINNPHVISPSNKGGVMGNGEYVAGLLPEDHVIEMYELTIDYLRSSGYIHYEISNFALPGYMCRHNLNYWNRGEYYGVGLGAHSFINGKRFFNTDSLDDYLQALSEDRSPLKGTETISEEKALSEAIFLGLRKTEGIDIRAFSERYKKHMFRQDDADIEELRSAGLIEFIGSDALNGADHSNCYVRLTRKGILLSNEVFAKFVK
jgi:oxygen-independent coproporphyrinogen-3 oxidase